MEDLVALKCTSRFARDKLVTGHNFRIHPTALSFRTSDIHTVMSNTLAGEVKIGLGVHVSFDAVPAFAGIIEIATA